MEKSNSPAILSGIGTDIIEIRRIQDAIARHGERFIHKLFTQNERDYCQKYQNPMPRYAGRFAAKEAIVKALGAGLQPEIDWQEIEIINDRHGKPEVYLSSRLKKTLPFMHLFVSISHCENYATATAIVMTGTI